MSRAFSYKRRAALLALATFLSACAHVEQAMPAAPQALPAAAHFARPADVTGDLLFVNAGCGIPQSSGICIFAYPSGRYVGWIDHYRGSQAIGLCSDPAGNVYVTSVLAGGRESAVLVYGHAGNGPTAILRNREYLPNGCAVDAESADLCVANVAIGDKPGNVAVFAKASGTPKFRRVDGIFSYQYCGYGKNGDLYVNGASKTGVVSIARLPKGATNFVKVRLDKPLSVAGPIQWDGERMAFGYGDSRGEVVYRADVSGERGTVVATTRLSAPDERRAYVGPFWIAESRIVATFKAPDRYPVAFWHYPKGGSPTRIIRRGRRVSSEGSVTISVPSSR